MKKDNYSESRRRFIRKSIITYGFAAIAPASMTGIPSEQTTVKKLPREVWIAGISQTGLRTRTSGMMVEKVIDILQEAIPSRPDFVCMPEIFPFTYVEQKTTTEEKLEISEMVLERFSEFSKQNSCYTVCPIYTRRDGNIYNSAVVFDRNGRKRGSYEKIHLTEGEIKEGFTCGPLMQPVIETEFGPIGIQICFDIEWDDGWSMLESQGARIIFWPSAFAGGQAVNAKAWMHKCVVATSTNKNTAKICDISGEVITQTGIWNPNLYCAPVNLEKVFLHTWPDVYKFKEIQKKYGRNIRITTFHEEEWSVIESLSPEIEVNDILKEFEMRTHKGLIRDSELLQSKNRK